MQEIHSPPAKRLRVGDRTLLACLRCKQKKLKCDGRSPKCQNCLKNVQECLIEDPATGLHRPRDHMQALESRVAYLEGLLQEVRPDLAADHMDHHRRPAFTVDGSEHRVSQNSRGDDARMNISQPPEGDIPFEAQPTVVRETHPVQASPSRPAESDTVSSEVGLLCVNASGREPQYLGCSSALSFAHIATNAMGLQGDFAHQRSTWAYNAATVRHKDWTKLLELRHPALAVAEALSQAFFDNIHPQYPFLHRPTFAKWERECQEANQKGTLQDVGHVPLFFVTMVYGIGSIALSHGLSGDAEDFYAMAMQHSPSVLNTDTLESVQALIACAVFSIRSPVGASLWMVSGMALRKSIGLGYHRSHHKLRRSSDVLPNEMAKRCFWVAYDIDRVTSFVLGRPPAISDQAIDVELPLDVNDEDLTGGQQPESVSSNPMSGPTTMTGAIHIIKLRRLWSKIHSLFYGEVAPGPQRCGIMDSTVQDLRQELEEWRQSVPPRIHHGNQKPLSVYTSNEWFILAYNHSILLLYRPFINDTAEQIMSTRSHPGLVEMAFDECYTNAQRMCMTYRSLYQQPSIQFTWGSLHILFLGGMTYLYCLWRSAKIRQTAKLREVMSTCMACSMVLVIVAERWGVATAYRDIFEKLSERTINMLELEGSRRTQIGYNNIGPPMTFQGPVDDTVPFDEWILDLDHAGMPPESDWLVQEMLDGVRGFGPHGTDDL